MVNTFDVGSVRVLEYMRTYQEYFRKLPILSLLLLFNIYSALYSQINML